MKRTILVALALSVLAGCAPPIRYEYQDMKIGSLIDIYSESSMALAQDKADKMCGSHAYFIINLKEDTPPPDDRYQSIRFSCDLSLAASEGSDEARKIQHEKTVAAYREYVGKMQQLKEARRKRADPSKYESYTETDPDGTVRSYNFFGGKSCEAIVYSTGSAETHCE